MDAVESLPPVERIWVEPVLEVIAVVISNILSLKMAEC